MKLTLLPFVSLLVLLLCGTACDSSESVTSTEPPIATASEGEQTSGEQQPLDSLPGAELFSAIDVLHFEFTLSDADWTALNEHGDDEQYVQAAVNLDNSTLSAPDVVGLRHKGNWTLHHCWDDFGGERSYEDICAKLSFKVKFDEYQPEQRLDGLKRLNLHALQVDQTKMHELIAYELFREFGVAAPRVRPATVSVNGRALGLFMAVEEIDGRFTKAHFPNAGDGNLYKEIWPSLSFSEQAFVEALESNEELGDVADILEFANAIAEATPETFAQVLSPHLDIEQLVRYLVVDRAVKNWDGISAFYERDKPHNFYWYHDKGGSETFVLVPWDLDNTLEREIFVDPPESGVAPVPDWNQAPANCDPRPTVNNVAVFPIRCDKLLDVVALGEWQRFSVLGNEFLRRVFTVERLQAKALQWTTLLEPWVAQDPTLDAVQWKNVAEQWQSTTLPGLVTSFEAFLSSGLSAEEPPPVIKVVPPTNVAIDDTGFSPTALNGFEFAAAATGMPDGVAYWTDEASQIKALLNRNQPIAGEADLLLDFSSAEAPMEAPYVGVGYYGSEADIRGLQYLVLTMRAEPERLVRVALSSRAYEEQFGGVWAEFSVQVNVPETAKQFVLPLEDFGYPTWAKDVWTAEQGWTSSDQDARALVLEFVNGLAFNPTLNPSGGDAGRLFVDDIYFY